MTYRVTSIWAGNTSEPGYTIIDNVRSFREMVEMGISQDDFLECVDVQNVDGWINVKNDVFNVLKSIPVEEKLDVENQIYTRTVDWPTKESYENWVYIKNNLLSWDPADYNGVSFNSPYVAKIIENGEEI